MELLIARNPDPESRLPYLMLLPLAGGMVFRTSGTWPRTNALYCYPVSVDEWPQYPDIVERAGLRSCVRRGAAIDLVLDRGRENRSQIVFTRARGRDAVFWQSPRTRKQARQWPQLPAPSSSPRRRTHPSPPPRRSGRGRALPVFRSPAAASSGPRSGPPGAQRTAAEHARQNGRHCGLPDRLLQARRTTRSARHGARAAAWRPRTERRLRVFSSTLPVTQRVATYRCCPLPTEPERGGGRGGCRQPHVASTVPANVLASAA